MSNALRVENLWKSYTAGVRGCSVRVWALRGCTFDVQLGERVAIVGGAGSGKSTLIRCLAGERRADAGHVITSMPLICRFSPRATSEPERLLLSPALVLIDDQHVTLGARRFDTTTIITSRDIASVRHLVDRIMMLKDGRLSALTHIAVRRVAEPLRPRVA